MIPHFLHIYQKPKQGNNFVRRLAAFNYRHKISAIGGFDTASCDVAVPPNQAAEFLDQFIGNRVAVFVDNPTEAAWEGFINRMTFSAGAYSFTIGLDEMMNRVSLTYSANGTLTNPAAQNDTESQAVYGIKEGNIDFGFQNSAGTSATAIAQTILNQRAWPKTSVKPGGGSGLVTVEMLGFYHTLSWEKRSDSGTGAITTSSNITGRILPGLANGNTFLDNTNFTDIATNSVTASVNRNRGQTVWEILREFAEIGDNTNYWVVGVTPTDPRTSKRRLYYRAFNSGVEYTARLSDGLRIRDKFGALLPPWTVRPDKGIRIVDILADWDGLGDDPRETWIAGVDYDANRQTATWTGDDNVTAEGVFQLHQYNRVHGRKFGAPRRTS